LIFGAADAVFERRSACKSRISFSGELMNALKLFPFLILLCVAGASLAAETQPGEILGMVTAQNKAGLPGTMITLRDTSTGTTITVVAGARGIYSAPRLRAGDYEVKAELDGFEPTSVRASLGEAEHKLVDFTLSVTPIHEIVTVVGSAPGDSFEAAEARESSARDIGEALSANGGVWKLRKGGIANDVVLRGFQSKDLNVLIDGQRIYGACPNHMDPPAFHADFSEVDRVEIGKGPFDVRNQGSLGGVINVVTRQADRGFHATGTLSTGSYGFVNPSATISYGSDRFSALGGYSWRMSQPYTDGTGKRFTDSVNYRSDALDSDAFRIGTAWGKFSFSPASNQLAQVSYSRQQADHMLYPYLQMDAVYDNADRVNFAYRIDQLSGLIRSLRFQGYYTQVDHWMTDQYRTSSMGVAREYSMGTIAGTKTFGGRAETELRSLILGVETYRRQWDTTTMMAGMAYKPQYSIPGVKTDSAGVYAEYRKPLTDRLKVEAGARLDVAKSYADTAKANTDLYYAYNSTRVTSVRDTLPSGSVRLNYVTPLGLELSGGIGHTSRVPEPQERFLALRRSGSDWVGNPLLSPSRNTGVEGNATFRKNRLFLASSLYFYGVQDFITINQQPRINQVTGIMNSQARSYQNVDARLYGSEIQSVLTVVQHLSVSADLSYVRGSQVPDPSRGILSGYLPEMPPLNSRAGMRYDIGRMFAEIEGVFVAAQHRVASELREQPTAGYGIGNIRFGADRKRLSFRGGVNNIFNRAYYEHLSYQRDPFRTGARVFEAGRNFFVNLAYRF
jgi:iron complex outermembrane receptor protein